MSWCRWLDGHVRANGSSETYSHYCAPTENPTPQKYNDTFLNLLAWQTDRQTDTLLIATLRYVVAERAMSNTLYRPLRAMYCEDSYVMTLQDRHLRVLSLGSRITHCSWSVRHPSVRLSRTCCNVKTKRTINPRIDRKVVHVTCNFRSSFEVIRSKVKVAM